MGIKFLSIIILFAVCYTNFSQSELFNLKKTFTQLEINEDISLELESEISFVRFNLFDLDNVFIYYQFELKKSTFYKNYSYIDPLLISKDRPPQLM
ncbi:MAG: hypothetical protein HYU67_13645 [Flavobacteriia bacterium]|nr:hypothetical protein [Flavobacteriia bacterium]